MARATTRTTLTLGDLLEIPIGVVPATGSSEELRFDTAAPDGAARKQVFVHPNVTETLYRIPPGALDDLSPDPAEFDAVEVPEVVTQTVKGVRVGDTFRQVPESEIEYATAATKLDSVELLEFIDYRLVPTDRLAGAFYLQPDPGFAKPLAVLMAAMRRDGKAMVVRWAARSRQRLGVIRVRNTAGGDVLLLNDVVFAAQWREPDDRVLEPAAVEALDERSVAAAVKIITSHHGTGKSLDAAEDELPALQRVIVERAHDGLFDDPARVLELAATFTDDGLGERADRLVAWAEGRWPELVEKRQEVAHVIAEGGDDIVEKLAALVA